MGFKFKTAKFKDDELWLNTNSASLVNSDDLLKKIFLPSK
jgi:hypothetical protein